MSTRDNSAVTDAAVLSRAAIEGRLWRYGTGETFYYMIVEKYPEGDWERPADLSVMERLMGTSLFLDPGLPGQDPRQVKPRSRDHSRKTLWQENHSRRGAPGINRPKITNDPGHDWTDD